VHLADYDKKQASSEIQALMDGKEAGILGKCVTCCACREYCPTGADPFDLILKMLEKTKSYPVSAEGVNMFGLAPTIPSQVIPGDGQAGLLLVRDAIARKGPSAGRC
jgi:ferredoxin